MSYDATHCYLYSDELQEVTCVGFQVGFRKEVVSEDIHKYTKSLPFQTRGQAAFPHLLEPRHGHVTPFRANTGADVCYF